MCYRQGTTGGRTRYGQDRLCPKVSRGHKRSLLQVREEDTCFPLVGEIREDSWRREYLSWALKIG